MKDKNIEKEKCNCKETGTCTCGENCECEDCTCKEDKECNCKETGTCTCGENCECEECTCKEDKENCKTSKKNKKCDKAELEKLEETIKLLSEKEKNLEDQLLRSKAEFQNYRKRLDEESIKFRKYANEDLVKELLLIVDNFERAISLDDENLSDELSKFLSGFKMTYCNLVSILEKYGVKAIDGNNKPFDPNYHQAVMTEANSNIQKGYVIDVLQKGYLLNGKVIRHAMVKVSE